MEIKTKVLNYMELELTIDTETKKVTKTRILKQWSTPLTKPASKPQKKQTTITDAGEVEM